MHQPYAGAGPHLASRDDFPWAQQEQQQQQQEEQIHKARSWDACSLATEALHTRGGSGAPGSPLTGSPESPRDDGGIADSPPDGGGGAPHSHSDSSIGAAAAGAVAAVDSEGHRHRGVKDMVLSGVDKLSGGRLFGGSHGSGGGGRGSRPWQKSASDEEPRPHKRQRAGSPPLPPRSLSDPGQHPMRRSHSASLMGGSGGDDGGQQAGSAAAAIAGSAAADEGFPGHNSVEDVHPAGKLVRLLTSFPCCLGSLLGGSPAGAGTAQVPCRCRRLIISHPCVFLLHGFQRHTFHTTSITQQPAKSMHRWLVPCRAASWRVVSR